MTDQGRAENKLPRIYDIALKEIDDFPDHPFKVRMDETNDLLSRAGYTFSHSNKRDVILEYFFASGKYDIYEINEVLFQLFQKPLGRMA